ncbi:MAG: hypothetical protein GOVbin1511_11 [Prokaryotic dsDNA virus sp.]|jgi:hypothetical protein|nr:MAG: hypothetical protein GOVbin1511_11 [Prokaryotic dsDNA virus sp.]|tara:strand:+ start:3626 stop:3919 length:294 start_codon:yes stop_codon:yes gene_type:complete
MKSRGKRFIRTRRAVGHILRDRMVGMSANEIAEALNNRERRTVQANPIKVAQLMRGAKGIESEIEARECETTKQEVKIYKMNSFTDYSNWIEGKENE